MASVHHLGLFPFCIKEVAEDGKPFEKWDLFTTHIHQFTPDGETAPDSLWIYQEYENSGGTQPSKLSSKLITVYGSGTRYFVGPLSLEELMYFYWVPKKYSATINGQYETSIDSITNTYGDWENAGEGQYVWAPFQETLGPLQSTLRYPNDSGILPRRNTGQLTEFTRLINPPPPFDYNNFWGDGPLDERQLVCSPSNSFINFGSGQNNINDGGVYGDFPHFRLDMSSFVEQDASVENFGGISLGLRCAFETIIDYRQAIKTGNDAYYLPIGRTGIYFESVGVQQKNTRTPTTFPEYADTSEYTYELFAYTFPLPYEINPLSISTPNPPPIYLSNKEISLTINFPSGARTFKTRVFMSDWTGYSRFGETIKHLNNGPMLDISISLDEYFEYDPNDGKGPKYDKTTGAKLRDDI